MSRILCDADITLIKNNGIVKLIHAITEDIINNLKFMCVLKRIM